LPALLQALLLALGAFCTYMGAYYVTVVPYTQKLGPGYFYSIGDYSIGEYRLPYEAYAFFSPAHWIDCRVRTEPWATQATGQQPQCRDSTFGSPAPGAPTRKVSPAHR
jgi:hypothetical protein